MTSPVGSRLSALTAAGDALDRIEADGRNGIWIELIPRDDVLAAATAVDRRAARGADLPLLGTTVAIKGNIDVAGFRTTAACPSFGSVADRSAPVVSALEAAGAVVVGITNLDQFATGLVGTRSPYGVCPNAHWPELVSGGSSSGSAVAVAAGLVDLALGTDTAGSGRVPAAANGIVGIKPTRGWASVEGVVPACRSLDCVSVFARDVQLASRAARILAATPQGDDDPWRRRDPSDGALARGVWRDVDRHGLRIGVPRPMGLEFDGDPQGPERFSSATDCLAATVPLATFVDVDLEPFLAAGRLLYGGAFVAERYDAVGPFVEQGGGDIDPVVREVIAASSRLAGWEVFRDLTALRRLRSRTEHVWRDIDVLVVPTVPRVPTQGEVRAEPFATNTMLGTYTNFVNLLDLCALTLPVGGPAPDGPPASLTLIGPAWTDELLVSVAANLT